VISYLQIVSLGPQIKGASLTLLRGLALVVLDFQYFVVIDGLFFYSIIVAYFGLVLCAMLSLGIYQYSLRTSVFSTEGAISVIKSVIDTLAPLLSGVAVVPILFWLFEVFSCVDEYDGDSYLTIDCEEKCWTQQHYLSALMSAIVCAMFILVAAELRAVWQAF
jgi:hypothetical protein